MCSCVHDAAVSVMSSMCHMMRVINHPRVTSIHTLLRVSVFKREVSRRHLGVMSGDELDAALDLALGDVQDGHHRGAPVHWRRRQQVNANRAAETTCRAVKRVRSALALSPWNSEFAETSPTTICYIISINTNISLYVYIYNAATSCRWKMTQR